MVYNGNIIRYSFKVLSFLSVDTHTHTHIYISELPEEAHFVTMDVKALYTNIPNNEGLQVLKEAMDKKQHKSVATTVIVTLIMSLILTLNNFVFNDKNYLQIKGCAMGTICAPPFANIFKGKFEETFIYPYIQNLCILYLRYIDDLFLIWTGTKKQFKDFVMNLNSQHPSIKFSFQISDKSIDFLDTTVYIKNRRLHTIIFTKPTDKQNYLHYKSEHPLPLKNNIPFGQILRIKRICSEALEFLKKLYKDNQQIYLKRLSRITNTRSILQDHLQAKKKPSPNQRKEKITKNATRRYIQQNTTSTRSNHQ